MATLSNDLLVFKHIFCLLLDLFLYGFFHRGFFIHKKNLIIDLFLIINITRVLEGCCLVISLSLFSSLDTPSYLALQMFQSQ